MSDCVFCRIAAGHEPATVLGDWAGVLAIRPLNPVVPGHVLVLPREHVEDFAADPHISAHVMFRSAMYAAEAMGPCNLITSKGREATQSVFHLHVHLVPRTKNDGLALPWDRP